MLQLHAVLAQNPGDFALGALKLADRTVDQQLRALADVRERRLQFVRHVAQEPVLLLRQFKQAQAQPVELRRELLQVPGSPYRDRAREFAAPKLIDRAVDRADGPAEQVREQADRQDGHRHQQQCLPEQLALRPVGCHMQVVEFPVDLLVAVLGHFGGHVEQTRIGVDQRAHL